MENTPKNDSQKITDKAMVQGIVISVISILMCIVALCSMTYAWFSTDVTSSENIMESGRFALEIGITNNLDSSGVVLTENENGAFTCILPEGEYTVVLKMTADTTASKGYCDIVINSVETLQTSPVSGDTEIGVDPLTFTLKVEGEEVTVKLIPKWGISAADETVDNGDTITVGTQPSTHEVE